MCAIRKVGGTVTKALIYQIAKKKRDYLTMGKGCADFFLSHICLQKKSVMKVKKYKVVKVRFHSTLEFNSAKINKRYAESLGILEKQVNAAISDGWEPQGGMTVYEFHLFQPMVKRG